MSDSILDRFYAWLPVLEPRTHRRQRLMDAPFPEAWRQVLHEQVPFWKLWSPARRAEAEPLVQAFEGDQRWVGAGGLTISEEMRVVISACAVRPVLRLGLEYYNHISEIVVYPYDRLTVPGHGEHVLGVMHPHGVVVLSWPAVQRGLAHPGDGHDTALHEFVHAIDLSDGVMDGAPPLHGTADYDPWARTLGARFDALQTGQETVLRPYGGESPAEFFAVASEHFFERPEELKDRLPDLHAQLVRFYGWDPSND